MPEPQFFQTAMGRTFFDHTLPRIAESLETLATQQQPFHESSVGHAFFAEQLPALIESIATLNANLTRIADALNSKEGSQ